MSKKSANLLLLGVGIFWGLGYISTELLLKENMGVFTLIGTRFLFGSILLGILFINKLKFNSFLEFAKIALIGFVLFLAFAFQTIAMNYTTTTNVSFITGVNIIFVPFIATIIFKSDLYLKNIIAAIIGFIGLGFLTGGMSSFNSGDFLTLLGAFFFGFHIVLISKFSEDIDIIKLAVWQMFICSIFSLLLASYLNEPIIYSIEHVNLDLFFFEILVPSALCFLFQNIGLKYTNESEGSLILSTESLWGAFFSILLLNEKFTFNILIGAILLIIAIYLDEIREFTIKLKTK